MKKIINKPVKYFLTCKYCGCVFEYTLEDINKRSKVMCPHCRYSNKHKGSSNVEYEDNSVGWLE